MKVERSTKHAEYMYRIAQQINARVAELLASGMSPESASKQASDEIVKPELERRAKLRRERQ
jgi:hypothetical protein